MMLGPAVREARDVVKVLREEVEPASGGPLLVTGMLAEQLARELARGAGRGAVVAADASRLVGASVLVHVIAGDPSEEDDALVREADQRGVPVVLVQLWAQGDWTRPFVLSPFVVECRTGEGFPVPEIARRIVDAVEQPVALARRVPALQDAVADAVVGTSAIRAAILGTLGARSQGTRPLLTLEQVRMLADLRGLATSRERSEEMPLLAGLAGAAVGAGFVFRRAARSGRSALPAPLVNAAVAGVATWVLGELFRRVEERIA